MSRSFLTFATFLTLASIYATANSAATLSASNRYEIDDVPSQPNEDQPLEVLKSSHRFQIDPQRTPSETNRQSLDNDIVPDLQVGCGDGLLVETPTSSKPAESKPQKTDGRKERPKREASDDRKGRSYFAYSVYTPASMSYSASLNYKTVFKPAAYALQRPYYIPIWGPPGKLPFYFPPQPVYIQSQFPLDNFPDMGYRPPVPVPTQPPTTMTTTSKPPPDLSDRFGGGPVWESRPAGSATPAPPTLVEQPTRRPNMPKTSTFPPLIHELHPATGTVPKVEAESYPELPVAEAAKPAPSAPSASSTPNPCAFAIVNCCSVESKDYRLACFERLGCPGPFWDRNPCEGDFANKAVNEVLNYYQDK